MRDPVDARGLLEALPDESGAHVLVAVSRVTRRRQEMVHRLAPLRHRAVVRVAGRGDACGGKRQRQSDCLLTCLTRLENFCYFTRYF